MRGVSNNLVGVVNNIGTGAENTQNSIGNLTTSVNTVSGVSNALTAGTNNVITATGGSNTISSAAGANQVVTSAAGATTGVGILGTGTTDGVSITGTSGGQTAAMTLGQDNRYNTGSPVVDFSTTGGAPIRVTGVSDGVRDFDAVNMRQFNASVGGLNAAVSGLAADLKNTQKLAYTGAAAAMALAGIPNPAPGKNYSFGVGVGSYEGYRAIAAGFKGRITENLTATLGAAFNNLSRGYNGGVSYSW